VLLAIAGHRDLGLGSTERIGGESLALAGWAFELQLSHLVWPDGLVARYYPPDGAALAVLAAIGVAAAAAIAVAVAVAWRRGHRAVAFGLGAALCAYAPSAGIIPLARGPADSYLYLPLALAVVAAARGLGAALGGDRWRGRRIALAAAIALAVVAALVAASRSQSAMWRDSSSLWSALAAEYPDEPRALVPLGGALIARGDVAAGLAVYDEIERRFPGFSDVEVARGSALAGLGRDAEADRALARAVARDDSRAVRETYGFFLVARRIEPADPGAARLALAEVAPLLAARGKRLASVRRAVELCDDLAMPAEAAALRARVAELERR
jgi:hypothetical protein